MRLLRFGPWIYGVAISGLAYGAIVGCTKSHPTSQPPARELVRKAPTSFEAMVTFSGMCDASAAVPIDSSHFLVANDEDNILRVYDSTRGGEPTEELDLTAELSVAPTIQRQKKRQPRTPKIGPPREADIEAATRLGDDACFLASHSKAGGPRAPRVRFVLFCTALPIGDNPMGIVGSPYRMLHEDLVASPLLSQVNLQDATQMRPPSEAAMNIEAMTASPEGGLWIGLRSPLHEGRAVLVLIGNPNELPRGGRARIDRVEFLDLGGLGARGLTLHRGEYLIAAGPASKGKAKHLYRWSPGTTPAELPLTWPDDFNVEGFFNDPGQSSRIMILSDDGDRFVDAVPCKKLPEPSQRRFRGLWLDRSAT